MKTIVNYAQKVKEQHALNKTLAPVETDLTDASRSYAIGEQFIYNGELFKAKTAIAQHDALVLNTNYEAADNLATEIEALTNNLSDEVEVRAKLGAHNLVDIAGFTLIKSSARTKYIYPSDIIHGAIPSEQVVISFKVTNSNLSKSNNYFKAYGSGGEIGAVSFQANGRYSFVFDGTSFSNFYIFISSDAESDETCTISEIMITLATDAYSEYTPYAKTNQQLTAENQTLVNNVKARAELSAYNLLNIFNSEINTNGTYTEVINDDGTVTIGGTPTSACTIPYKATAKYNGNVYNLKPNTDYVLDSGLSAISPLNLQVFVKENSGSSWSKIAETTTDTKLQFTTPASFYDLWVRILVPANAVVPASTIVKPMIILASDITIGFEPYAMTNRELTKVVTPLKGSFTYLSATWYYKVFKDYIVIGSEDAVSARMDASSWATMATITELAGAFKYALNGMLFPNNGDVLKLNLQTTGELRYYRLVEGDRTGLYIQDNATLYDIRG